MNDEKKQVNFGKVTSKVNDTPLMNKVKWKNENAFAMVSFRH